METRNSMLQNLSHLTTLFLSDFNKFLDVVLGTEWIDDKPLQLFIIEFLNRLCLVHNIPLLSVPTDLGYSSLVEIIKSKKKVVCPLNSELYT